MCDSQIWDLFIFRNTEIQVQFWSSVNPQVNFRGWTSGRPKLFLVEDFSEEFGRKLPKLRDVFSRLLRKVKNSPDRTYSQAPTALVTKEVIFTWRSNESSAVLCCLPAIMQYDRGPLDRRPMKIEMFGTPPPAQDKPQPAAAQPRPCKWSELPDLAIRAWVNLGHGCGPGDGGPPANQPSHLPQQIQPCRGHNWYCGDRLGFVYVFRKM